MRDAEGLKNAADPVRTPVTATVCPVCGHRFPEGGQQYHSKAACRAMRWRKTHPTIGRRQTDLFWTGEIKKRQKKGELMLELLRRGPQVTFDMMRVGGAGFSSRLREIRTGEVDGVKHKVIVEQHQDYAVYTLEEEDD